MYQAIDMDIMQGMQGRTITGKAKFSMADQDLFNKLLLIYDQLPTRGTTRIHNQL